MLTVVEIDGSRIMKLEVEFGVDDGAERSRRRKPGNPLARSFRRDRSLKAVASRPLCVSTPI